MAQQTEPAREKWIRLWTDFANTLEASLDDLYSARHDVGTTTAIANGISMVASDLKLYIEAMEADANL